MSDRRRLRGEIGYFRAGGERTGRELFSMAVHADGSRTLRAWCEMDDEQVVRDVILAMAPGWTFREAYVRLVVGGRHGGSGWFRAEGAAIACDSLGREGERRSERLELEEAPRFFGTHALANDAWLAALAHKPGTPVPACSAAANGATPPGIVQVPVALEALGTRPLTVAAGRFDAQGFAVRYGDYPPLTMWVSGEDLVLVRMEWSHLDGVYELVNLRG